MAKKANIGGAREGAGRPAEYADQVHVKIVLPHLVLDVIDAIATKEGIGRGAAIRLLLAKHKPIKDALAAAKL